MLYSHYEEETGYKKPLLEHIAEVYAGLCSIDESLREITLFNGIKNRLLIYKLIAFLHDFGKASIYFQDKLLRRESVDLKKNSSLANHALLGAILSLYFAELLGFELPVQLLIYRLLHSHHSNSHKPQKKIELDEDDIGNLGKQYTNILNNSEATEIKQLVESEIELKLPDENQFAKFIQVACRKIILCGVTPLNGGSLENDRLYWLYFYLLSALNRADKHSASLKYEYDMEQTNKDVFSIRIDSHIIDRHIESKESSTNKAYEIINKLRNKFYGDVNESILKVGLDNHLFFIHAPTGIGKTLTLLNASIKLQTRLKDERNTDYRIIYGLPFLSIIDQVSSEIGCIFNNNEINADWRLFQEYHHLSTPIISESTDNESCSFSKESLQKAQIQLLSSFLDSQIVLTTFVSLFEAISDSHQSIKLISFARSIIIIDEIQSLDAGLYAYALWYLKCLARYFDCYVFVSSATIPQMFLSSDFYNIVGSEDTIELNFSQLNRYTVHHPLSVKFEEFQACFESNVTTEPEKSYLIVTNTKSMAYRLASWLKTIHNNVYYLSTLVVPYQRIKRIESIKKDSSPKIVVSTQLIEAGVDLSFNTIFRFLAPLDSIIQASGRTNRSLELGYLGGNVHIIDMIYDNGRKDYQSVYIQNSFRNNGDIRIDATKHILEKHNSIEEYQLYLLGKEFFRSISDSSYWPTSYRLLELHKWNEFGDKIRVISNDIPSSTVLICAGNWSQYILAIYDAYLSLLSMPAVNHYARKAELRDLMRELSPYCLNLSTNELNMLYEISNQKQESAKNKPLQIITEQYDECLGLDLFSKSTSVML